MTFLPIVRRELRVRAHQTGTYRSRGLGALLALGATLVALMFGATSGRAGASAFSLLAFLAFAFCLLEGLRNTADCLSEEKRAGTLGFLFLTDLKGYDVVLGKMLAASLTSLYVLIAVLPAFALPLLIGGVTAGEFWRLVLVLVETLLFSLSLGMLVSASSRDETAAWVASVALMLVCAIIPPVIRTVPFLSAPWIEWLSPSVAFATFREAAYKAQGIAFWKAAAGTGLLSLAFIAVASWVLPRAWQDHPRISSPACRELPAKPTLRMTGANAGLLNDNPVIWLTSRRQTRQQVYLWLLVLICGSLTLVLSFAASGFGPFIVPLLATLVALHLVLAVFVTFKATYTVSEAKNSGALELLFSTPLRPQEIVDGFLMGIKRQFFWPVVALLSVEVLLLVSRIMSLDDIFGFEGLMTSLFGGAILVMFVMDLYAVAIFGMWTALHAKKPSQAFTRTITLVMVLPTILGVCCMVLPITGILKNMIFLSYRQSLYQKFRRMVSDPHVSGP
jgi:hypothetical protein